MRRLLIILIIVALVAAGYFWLTRDVPLDVLLTIVEKGPLVVTVTPTTLSSVKADLEVNMAAESAGRIIFLPFEEGDTVASGEILFQVDPRDAESLLRTATSTLAMARAKLEISQRQRDLEATTLHYEIEISEASMSLSAKTLDRAQSMIHRGGESAARLDEARRNYDAASGMLAQKMAMREMLDLRSAEVALARAAVLQAESDVKAANLRLSRTTCRAPFGGVITRRFVSCFENVMPGTPVVTMIDPDDTYIHCLVDETDVGRVGMNQTCAVTLDAFPDKELTGRVIRISPVVTGRLNETKTFAVRVALQDPLLVKPGQSCDVRIIVARQENVLAVSTQSLVEKNGKTVAYVLEGDRLKQRELQLGLFSFETAEVIAGLSPGDRLISRVDSKAIRDGALAREAKSAQ